MNKSTIEAGQTEQVLNNEQKADSQQFSPSNANAPVSGSAYLSVKKYRAWDESQKYMAYQGSPDLETLQSFMHHFSDKQLMQSTGFQNKSGQEIFEGDIMTYTVNCLSEDGLVRKDKKGRHIFHALVCFDNGQFCGKEIRNDGKLTYGFPLSVLFKETVEGNLFQLPEKCFLKADR